MFSEDYIDPKNFRGKVDIIGVNSDHEKNYLKEYVVINTDKFEVKGLTKGKLNYFKNFINKIKNMDINLARQDVNVFTNNLVNDTNAIVELMNKDSEEEDEEDEIAKIFQKKDQDERDAILEIASTYNPESAEKISKVVSKKVSSWMNDFF